VIAADHGQLALGDELLRGPHGERHRLSGVSGGGACRYARAPMTGVQPRRLGALTVPPVLLAATVALCVSLRLVG